MKVRRASVFIGLMLAVSSLLLPATASAASIGACSTPTTSYQSGENFNGVQPYGIFASVSVGSTAYFAPCSGSDGNLNAASVNIGISYGQAWVEIGIINCDNPESGWPSATCSGNGPRFFGEQHGQQFWDHNMWDLGAAGSGAHTLQILYSGGLYRWAVDGTILQSFSMGAGLVPTNTNDNSYWQVETKDAGDGLGTSAVAANVGQLKSYYSSAWHNIAVGSACDFASSQHHCVVNGSYGFYGYTAN